MSDWLTPAQAAEHLQVKIGTLKYWRRSNTVAGPPFSRIKTIVRYRRRDLDEWLDQYRVAS
ncbi:MAG: helix-turn-helix domain-containing protein [Woeseia sp.]